MSGNRGNEEHYMVDIDDGDSYPTDNNVDQATTKLKSIVTKRKGRGFSSAEDTIHNGSDSGSGLPAVSNFDTLHEETSGHAQRSVEGWVLFIAGLHEEATEDDLHDRFADYGQIKGIKVNLDHRTGYVKGYGLVEFATYEEARKAKEELDGSEFMEGAISVDFAFVRPPVDK